MGRRVVTRALASGHSVTAFSRHPDGAGQGERLRKIAGDVRNSADVSHIVEGQDAVVVTLGAGLRKSDLLERAIENIMISMRRFGVRRIVALGPAGALHGIREASRDQSLPTKLVMQVFVLFVIKNLMEQQRLMQRAIASSGLDYTIVNPPRLLGSGTWSVSRARPRSTARGYADCLRRRGRLHRKSAERRKSHSREPHNSLVATLRRQEKKVAREIDSPGVESCNLNLEQPARSPQHTATLKIRMGPRALHFISKNAK